MDTDKEPTSESTSDTGKKSEEQLTVIAEHKESPTEVKVEEPSEAQSIATPLDHTEEQGSEIKGDLQPIPCTATGTATRTNAVKDENGFTYYKCRFCGLTFNYMNTLKAHERVHDIDQPYLCNKCGESFHFGCELEYHAKQHMKQKGYKCDCGRTFYQYTDLLYHHHPGEDPPLAGSTPLPPVPVLPSSSAPSAIHPEEFPTPAFIEKGFEPKHPMKVYSEVRTKPYICQYCSKSYSDCRGLSYHMYSHRGERIFNPRASRYLMCRNDNSYISPGAD